MQRMEHNVRRMEVVLESGPIAWSFATLLSLLREARDRAGKIPPGKPLSPADEQFLGQLLALCKSARACLVNAADYRNPWQSLLPQAPAQQNLMAEPQYFFSGDN